MATDLEKLRQEELFLSRLLIKKEWNKSFESFASHNLVIVDKNKKSIPFKLNYVQRKINDKIEELKAAKKPVHLIILKARQEGVTTYFQGRMLWHCALNENQNALIAAHRSDSTANIFGKSKYMVDHLPEDIKPLQKASNSTELIFDQPTHYKGTDKGLNSKIRIQTAGTSGIGRGDTFSYVHLSEFAFWEGSDDNSPLSQLSAIQDAIPEGLDIELAIESTANGMNDFKDLWDGAIEGANSMTPLFFPWWVHEEYTTPFESLEQKDTFFLSMTEYELFLYNDLKLDLERCNWYRKKLRTKNNNLALMKQENPSTAEEAFIMSGTPVFDNDRIAKKIASLRAVLETNPYKEGYFSWQWSNPKAKDEIIIDSVKFVESSTKNYVRIYIDPVKRVPYVLGGDTKGEGKDWYAGQVIDNRSGMRCATLQMQVNHSHPYTHQMYCLGCYYNWALIGIEMNFNTGPIDELDRLDYPNQYQRQAYDNYKRTLQDRYGWKTTGTTRPLIIDNEILTVSEHIDLFFDIPTLREMLTFMWDDRGRADAISGKHDDLLMADMIANEIRTQQITGVFIPEEEFDLSELPQDLTEDYLNAEKRGNVQELLRYWEDTGVLDTLRESLARKNNAQQLKR